MLHFQTKNLNLGKYLSVLKMEDVGIFGLFYGHLVYFYYHLVNFVYFPGLVLCTKKNLATLVDVSSEQCDRKFFYKKIAQSSPKIAQFVAQPRHFDPTCASTQAFLLVNSGANSTIVSYNASAVTIYKSM
jgi:hypothetical protein